MATPQRRFLFLQGPHGSFFSEVAERLMSLGHDVQRINFNGGDKHQWGYPTCAEDYTSTLEDLPEFLALYLRKNRITDLVFNGYWRPVHRIAIKTAREAGVRLHGFEEGLLRPNWVTVDPRLPCEQTRDIRQYMMKAWQYDLMNQPEQDMESPRFPILPHARWKMYFRCLDYYLGYFWHLKKFSAYHTHRLLSPAKELWSWVPQLFRYPLRKIQSESRIRRVLKQQNKFFLLCLQLEGDSQIQQYSDFNSMQEVMAQTVAHFALHAPKDHLLVIKSHPLDTGINNHEDDALRLARQHGIENRVIFIWYGKMAGLVRQGSGMITINSTSGLQALHHQCPVKTLGQAMYNLPGLVDDRDWQYFFKKPLKPNPPIWQALRRFLLETSQVDGNFYVPSCYPHMLGICIDKIIAAPVVRLEPPVRTFSSSVDEDVPLKKIA